MTELNVVDTGSAGSLKTSRPGLGISGFTVSSRRATALFFVASFVALVIRLALSNGGGNQWDLDVYKSWARTIAERGVVHAYDGPVIVDYPPVFLYWLELGGRVYRALISPDFDVNRPEMTLLIRMPGLVLDVVLGWMIFRFVRTRAGDKWGLAAALAYLFCPPVVFDLAFWGMPDSPHAVMIIGALWLALAGRPFWAWALISIAVFTKPQADIYAPMIALISLRDGGLRACVRGAAGIVAGVLLALLPFIAAGTLSGVFGQVAQMANYDPFISNNAHNVWWLVGWGYGWQIRDSEPFIGPLSYRAVALILVLAFYVFAMYQTWSRRTEAETLEVAAYVGLVLFMLMTVVHENHIYAVLPILALIWWRERFLGILYLVLTCVFMVNLVLHDATIYELLQRTGLHRELLGLTLSNAVVYVAILVAWSLRLSGICVSPLLRRSFVSVAAIVVTLAFAFSPRVITATYDPATVGTPSDAVFAQQIRLLGYSVKPSRIAAGGYVDVDLVWQATRDLDTNYMLFVHILDRDFRSGGQKDGPPTRNLYPTRLWRQGEVIHDQRTVQLEPNAHPGVYTIEAGLYPLTDYKRLPVVSNGKPDDKISLGTIVVPVSNQLPALGTRAGAPVGSFATLEGIGGAGIDGVTAHPGQEARFDLVWSARAAAAADYTVFVQLLSPDGVVAQYDAQLQRGNYPTSVWQPGNVIVDPVVLLLPGNLVSGEYRLIAGMYDLTSGARLPAGTGDFVELGRLRVTR